ncbi:MAG TPA: hypothetical protein VLE73_03260, partial [Candidatus Saccharimonadales bacterium]|nr:hypothetical protein [Candidatus Saccharimonadales bacterium]
MVQAAWNGQLYNPGITLDPECEPGVANCDIRPPANSGNNTNITQMSGLTVPLNTMQGGTGLSTTVSLGSLLVGDGSNALTLLSAGTNGQILGYGSGGPQWITPAAGTAYTAGSGLNLSGTTFSLDVSSLPTNTTT